MGGKVEQAVVGGAEEQSGRTSLGKPGIVFFNQIRRHQGWKPGESASTSVGSPGRRRDPAVYETTRKPMANPISNRADSADVFGRRQDRGRGAAGLASGRPRTSSATRSSERAAKGS